MKLHAAMLAFLMLGYAAPALADTIENSYGNTITVTGPDGSVARYYFEPDGTFSAVQGGNAFHGAWEIRGDQICLKAPEVQAEEDCSPYPADKNVGDAWSEDAGGGATVSFTITRGR